MLRNRFYYSVKPLVPRSVRLAVRRWLAVRKRMDVATSWPILPGSEKPPVAWTGWPGGKQFALVLTHDVEDHPGHDNCGRLMELELKLGFRSSFNLVPEGHYRVSPDLRAALNANGFEVGVHDVHHDGKLYRSRQEFVAMAGRINRYLEDWGAVGFRSGFMFRNLAWLHDLKISYDASTFDTDPFEPQPDGVGTIFPFWIAAPDGRKTEDRGRRAEDGGWRTEDGSSEWQRFSVSRSQRSSAALQPSSNGYVELPYTLPQDSTLFVLFQEKSPEIWLRKLDWIAKHGGMALVNIHPDYVNFSRNGRRSGEYPVQWVEEFLRHVQSKYAGAYWNPLPRELAQWYRTNLDRAPAPADLSVAAAAPTPISDAGQPIALRGKRAAVLLYSYYPADPRPRRAAESLVKAGMEVDLVCLRERETEPANEVIEGVNVYRIPLKKRRESKMAYAVLYSLFLLGCSSFLTRRMFRRRYDLVHIHNMPDFLAFAALIPRLYGARLILDLHDPMPELMMSIYGLPERHPFVRLLRWLEKRSIAFVNAVLTPNIAFRELFIRRGCPPQKIDIVMNTPQTELFDPARYPVPAAELGAGENKFRLMYHGLIAERHGLDIALRALLIVRDKIPEVEFHIFGRRTAYMDQMDQMVRQLGLQANVKYHGQKPQTTIAAAITGIALGIIPNRRGPFTEINMPTRIFEYLAMGKPVIVPATKGIRDYFDDKSMLFFDPASPEDLAEKIVWAHENQSQVSEVVQQGRNIYLEHCWPLEEGRLKSLVGQLVST